LKQAAKLASSLYFPFLGSYFDPEDGSGEFLWNVGLLSKYTVLQPRSFRPSAEIINIVT
jgi:hypothetical protein